MEIFNIQINGDTQLDELANQLAIEIQSLTQKGEGISTSSDQQKILQSLYEELVSVKEWGLSVGLGQDQLCIKNLFVKMSEQRKLSLFHKRINQQQPSLFDDYLEAWWKSRY